jgi:uncharacterized protein (DUF983 family)
VNQHLKIVDENIKRAFEGYHFDNGSDLDPGITQELRIGDLCPKCKSGKLDYDGLLTLSCVECGFALAGCFT